MRRHLLLLALVAACAAPGASLAARGRDPSPAGEVAARRVWSVVWTPEALGALRAGLPYFEDVRPVSADSPLGRVVRCAEVPGLDPEVVRAAAMAELRRLYDPYVVRFEEVLAPAAPPASDGRSAVVLSVGRGEQADPGWLLGRSDSIDPWDSVPGRLEPPAFGVFVRPVMMAVQFQGGERGVGFGNPESGAWYSAGNVGRAIGVILAHEVGHALGLLHLGGMDPESMRRFVMAAGGHDFSPSAPGAEWTWIEQGYLATALGARPMSADRSAAGATPGWVAYPGDCDGAAARW